MAAKEGEENWGVVASTTARKLIRTIGAETRSRGRPVVHDAEQCQREIVARLMTGESLPMICLTPDLPSLRTANRWIADDPEFADAVQGARHLGVQTLLDAAYDIASGGNLSTGSIERDKLLCSVIKWIVAKRDPENTVHLSVDKLTISYNRDDLDLC